MYLVLLGISWVVRYDLCNNVKITSTQINRYIAITALFSLILAVILIYVGGVQLDTSGSYCFIPFSSISSGCTLIIAGVLVQYTGLAYNAMVTYTTIMKAQRVLEDLGIHEQAKGRYIQMAKKLGIFFIATMTFYSIPIVSALYEWTTGQYFPATGSIAAGMSVTLLSSIVNPSLFFYLNVDLREKFWEKFGAPTYRLLGIKDVEPTKFFAGPSSMFSHIIPLKRRKFQVHCDSKKVSSESAMSGKQEILSDYAYWLSHEKLAKAIKEFARKEYVTENFLFYEDAVGYRHKSFSFRQSGDEAR